MSTAHTTPVSFKRWLLMICSLFWLSLSATVQAAPEVELELPRIALNGIAFSAEVKAEGETGPLTLQLADQSWPLEFEDGSATLDELTSSANLAQLKVLDSNGSVVASGEVPVYAGWLSLVPAMTAIIIALVFRQVIMALFTGILIGGWLSYGMTLPGMGNSLLEVVNVHVLNASSDSEHMSIVLFCLLIGGMVGIISRNGGTLGIASKVTKFIHNRRQAQVTTGLLGVSIFFDDYANALIVGNTMRNITDKLRISREKLAYIVDCTAAPVSSIMLVTTWIGFQVGLIDEALGQLEGFTESAYTVFVSSIAYSFYPILALAFVFMIAWTGRDFGPMLTAETRARKEGINSNNDPLTDHEAIAEEANIQAKPGAPARAFNAVLPILALVIVTMTGIYQTGLAELDPGGNHSLSDIFGNGDSFASMMWGSVIGTLVAMILTAIQRIMSMDETVHYWFEGVKSMLLPITILVMAWSLSSVNETLQTSDFLVAALGDTLAPQMIPVIVFVLSAFTAFATGSSWGVMGIMMPLVIPLTWAVMSANGMTGDEASMHIFYSAVAGVLAGAVWGDHCSPLAETTLLAAMASGCDLVQHVRTQLPYAVFVGTIATLVGTLPVAYGLPWWIAFPVAAVLMMLGLRLLGKKSEDPVENSVEEIKEQGNRSTEMSTDPSH
ncbi:MAG: Na+/H+ antiporter NhaC family protein [Marinobacterium sp.]|nr:Na+/H+ antiporter NhaC family protein [Marinobacterium sp.]